MTTHQIANKVAFFLRKARTSFLDDGGDDIIVNALNNARLHAERIHDFAPQQARVGLTVDPVNGGDVINASFLMAGDTVSTTPVRVKSVDTAYLQDATDKMNWYPLLLDQKRLLAKKAKEQNYKFRGNPTQYGYSQYRDVPLSRYAADARNYLSSRPFRGYWQGDFVFMDPRPPTAQTWIFDAQLWMTDYISLYVNVATSSTGSATVTLTYPNAGMDVGDTILGRVISAISANGLTITLTGGNANATIASPTWVTFTSVDSQTDWLTEEGSDYLMWAAMVECNYFTETFVQRQDGYNVPPEKARDLALQALMVKDDYKWELGSEPYLVK